MASDKLDVLVTLYDNNGNAKFFKIVSIFPLQNTEDYYCCIVSEDDESDILFLKYDENEDEENISLSEIDNDDEYSRVEEEYTRHISEAAVTAFKDSLLERNDLLQIKDIRGNILNFLMQATFEDPVTGREYVAFQRVYDNGIVDNNIELMVRNVNGDEHFVEPILNDIEYQSALEIFENLLLSNR